MTSPASRPAGAPPASRTTTGRKRRPEWVALAVAAVLVVAAFTAEEWARWGDVHAFLEPLSAYLEPTLGPGVPLALALAVVVVTYGPPLAERLPWRRLLVASWLTGLAWSVSLALVRGWSGIAEPLTNYHEYIVDVPVVDDLTELLPGFTERIAIHSDGNWITHVAGHPPLTFLAFLWLDRIGLGGPVWGALVITLLASTAVPAVLVTLRLLGAEQTARLAAPYLVLMPLVTWSVVSADGVFMAAAAWGLALLAAAGAAPDRYRATLLGAAAGVALGLAINLSYGLALAGALSLAVLAAARSWRPLLPAIVGALAVVGVFAALGFWWLEGQDEVVNRYYQGIAADRPQSYWVWANLAIVCFCVGPGVVAAIGRAVATARRRAGRPDPAGWLALGAVVAILAADLSGLSRSEVERIWLPFMVWLVPLASRLDVPDGRRWLAAQAGWAIAISIVLRFTW